MFLYLLNDKEGKAFIELVIHAMNVCGKHGECPKVEYETYLAELNLHDYQIVGCTFEDVVKEYEYSSLPVKRSVIIELCGILCVDNEIDNEQLKWIYTLSDLFELPREEAERLVRWSKDFSDFLEIGLMYINAKS